MKDLFKKHIKGFRKDNKTCECCRETTKPRSRRMARRRLKQDDRAIFMMEVQANA